MVHKIEISRKGALMYLEQDPVIDQPSRWPFINFTIFELKDDSQSKEQNVQGSSLNQNKIKCLFILRVWVGGISSEIGRV